MQRFILAGVIALVIQAADAKPPAEPAPPKFAAVAHAATICTDKGAFGRLFPRGGYGHVDTTADDDWAPFEKLSIAAGEITAVAPFRGAGDSRETDEALAEKFRKALDKAVEAKHHFAKREAHHTGVAFHAGKEPGHGLTLEIRQEDDHVVATCLEPGD